MHFWKVILTVLQVSFCLFSFFYAEVGKEIECRLQFWQARLYEIEEKYRELLENCLPDQTLAKRKQKGRKRQKVANDASSELFNYAADIVFQFFLQVIKIGAWFGKG